MNNITMTFDATILFTEIVRTQAMIKSLAFHSLGASKYSEYVNSLPDMFGKTLIDFVENNRNLVSDPDKTIRDILSKMKE